MQKKTIEIIRSVDMMPIGIHYLASTVCEPTGAVVGDNRLIAGNWFSAISVDGGNSIRYVYPETDFAPPDGQFCCDQTILFDHSRKLWIWLLQFGVGENSNTNVLRLSIIRGGDLATSIMYSFELQPPQFKSHWSGEWFDYNHAALSNNFLYIGTNVFTVSEGLWTRSIVMKIPLDQLAMKDEIDIEFVNTEYNGSLRCTQGATDTMHIVSHNPNQQQIRIYSWPEGLPPDQKLVAHDVDIQLWKRGNYVAEGPDGRNWLGRCDGRITGAWVSKGIIGCMWTANGVGDACPYPYIRVARIAEEGKELIDQPDIWNKNYAYAYPDVYPNSHGEVGMTACRGGG